MKKAIENCFYFIAKFEKKYNNTRDIWQKYLKFKAVLYLSEKIRFFNNAALIYDFIFEHNLKEIPKFIFQIKESVNSFNLLIPNANFKGKKYINEFNNSKKHEKFYLRKNDYGKENEKNIKNQDFYFKDKIKVKNFNDSFLLNQILPLNLFFQNKIDLKLKMNFSKSFNKTAKILYYSGLHRLSEYISNLGTNFNLRSSLMQEYYNIKTIKNIIEIPNINEIDLIFSFANSNEKKLKKTGLIQLFIEKRKSFASRTSLNEIHEKINTLFEKSRTENTKFFVHAKKYLLCVFFAKFFTFHQEIDLFIDKRLHMQKYKNRKIQVLLNTENPHYQKVRNLFFLKIDFNDFSSENIIKFAIFLKKLKIL